MTDYYPMIARCLADLEDSVAVRHEFYWLSRAELAVQLSGLDPPITQSEIICERLALDEAIRKVEAERPPSIDTQRLNPATQGGSTSMLSRDGALGRADIHLCPDMHLVTQGRQRQPSDAIVHESTSAPIRPLITKFAGALFFIALVLTLYHQGHHFTALLFRSPAAQAYQVVNSSPTITYYVGQLGDLISTAERQLRK